MESNNSYGYDQLSEKVIIEILLRLKVKSLLRFKCVSRKWYAIIESKSFIRNHLNHQSNHLLVHHYEDDKKKYAETLFMDETLLRYEQPQHLQLSANYVEPPFGHIDGIFCVIDTKKQLALWNPATQEFRPLPVSRPDIAPHYTSGCYAIGLGFEPLTSDYKVVLIRNFAYFDNHTHEEDIYLPQVVSVYTFSSDSWRHFEDEDVLNHLDIEFSASNTYLNGFFYWLACSEDYYAVVAFDMCKEVFKEIQIPDDIQSLYNQLCLYKKSVALISFDLQALEGSIDIWLMNESESWTKHITIGPLLDLKWNSVDLWDNKLFRTTRSFQVISYDLDTREVAKFEAIVQNKKGCCFRNYKESLISVKRKN